MHSSSSQPTQKSFASSQPSHKSYSFPQTLPSSSGPPSTHPASTPAHSPPPSLLPSAYSSGRPSLAPTRASSSSTHSDMHPSSNSAPPGQSAMHSSSPAAAGSGPTNDDIEAVIQMAMASSTRTNNPPRDTRTQLFVGNLPYRVRWQDLKDLFRRAGTVLRADVSLGPDNRSRGYGTVMLATAEDAGRAVDMFNGYTWQTRTLEVRPDRMGEEINFANASFPLSVGVGLGMPLATGAAGTAGAGLGMFGTPLVGGLSPVSADGAMSLASPAPSLAVAARFPNLISGVGALADEDGGSSAGAGSSQSSRNLFVGNLPFHIQWQDLKDLFRQAGAVQRADVALGADGRSRGFGTVSFSNEGDAERAVRMFNGYEYNGRPLKVHFDKFAPPASSSAPLVGPTASSAAALAFAPAFAHEQQQQQQQALARASSLAQQLLASSVEQARANPSLLSSRRTSEHAGAFGEHGRDGEQEAELAAQLARKLSVSVGSPQTITSQMQSFARQHSQHQQHPQQHAHRHPTHIPIPPAIQLPYTFDFLHSGPTTPYDVYDLSTYQRMSAASMDAYVQQQQPRTSAASSESPSAAETAQHSPLVGTTSPSSSRSHSTPQQQNHHPAHPGPIALPPPPPVTAFPHPPSHTLSPQYAMSPHMHGHGHPMSPLHHPMMGMGMAMMTPHGLPPITPSMPSFTFLPQASPGLPSPPVPSSNDVSAEVSRPPGGAPAGMYEHMRHVMAPFTPFSPGTAMSPGAFWGRAGSGANPFINPAVGAPVRSDQYFGQRYPSQQQQGEQDGSGYFPPIGELQAQAHAQEPPGYFPWVPPLQSQPSDGQAQGQVQRTSGLANEILRDDSAAFGRSQGLVSTKDGSPGDSDGTTTTGSASTVPETSSRGTSWHADEDAGMSEKAQLRAEARARGAGAVETFVPDESPSPSGVALDISGHGTKPRAYSNSAAAAAAAAAAGGRIELPRADSDPVRTLLKEPS